MLPRAITSSCGYTFKRAPNDTADHPDFQFFYRYRLDLPNKGFAAVDLFNRDLTIGAFATGRPPGWLKTHSGQMHPRYPFDGTRQSLIAVADCTLAYLRKNGWNLPPRAPVSPQPAKEPLSFEGRARLFLIAAVVFLELLHWLGGGTTL